MTARPRPGFIALLVVVPLVAGCVPAQKLRYERHLATVIEPLPDATITWHGTTPAATTALVQRD